MNTPTRPGVPEQAEEEDRTISTPQANPVRRVVIVGGVAGGMSAATRLRRLDESAEIVVFERGKYVSFANCGLPYYVGGIIPDRDSLLLQTPASLAARFRLDVRVRSEVTGIDRAARTVSVRDSTTGREYSQPYDAVVLAAGASAGALLPGTGVSVRTLRTIDDVDEIDTALETAPPGAKVVVVGAGFIGLEAVENLFRRGLDLVLVQRGDRPLSPLDPEMAAPVLSALQRHGVDVRLNTTVTGITDGRVHLDDGDSIEAALVIEARGARPDASLARSAGLEIGPTGGIAVDALQRTSDPSIYAVGDAVEKVDAVDGAATLVALAGLANRHGRTAADAICGVATPSRAALGTSIIGLFGLTIAMLGWNEQRLQAARRAYRVVHTHPSSHATYYPGAQPMAMKVLIDADTDVILGAQIVGGEGVDKRIDVLATAMAAGMTASALADLELAYAPQYGSAKDPINLAGYVAENLATGTTRSVQWHELDELMRSGHALIDVRSPQEFAQGAIPGAVNLPLDTLRDRVDELPAGPLVVHCQVGQRGHTAARILTQLGRDVANLDGGYLTWNAGNRPTAPSRARAPEPDPTARRITR